MELSVLFKSVLEQDKAPVVICDLDNTIVYMNPAAVEYDAKRGGAELLGKSVMNCHAPRTENKIATVLDWFKKSPENNIVYTQHKVPTNEDVYMVALRDDEGTLVGYYEKHEYKNAETMERYKMD